MGKARRSGVADMSDDLPGKEQARFEAAMVMEAEPAPAAKAPPPSPDGDSRAGTTQAISAIVHCSETPARAGRSPCRDE